MTVSLLDISTYLPGEPVRADYYAGFAESDELRENVMFRAPKFRHHVGRGRDGHRHGGASGRGHRRTPRPRDHRERRHPDHPRSAARYAVLRQRRRDGASPWHETELGARPAQRRVCRIRARHEGGPQPDRVRAGGDGAGRRRTERGGHDLRPEDHPLEGAGLGARRRCGRRSGRAVGQVADPRHRMPHLRRIRRRHDDFHGAGA